MMPTWIGGGAIDLHSMFFNSIFPDQDALKSIVRRHGQILFQPFDQEGLRVESLHLEVDPLAQFRMQPCRFIRSDILVPLKALIDQFVRDGVLVLDISCTQLGHSSQEGMWNLNGSGL